MALIQMESLEEAVASLIVSANLMNAHSANYRFDVVSL